MVVGARSSGELVLPLVALVSNMEAAPAAVLLRQMGGVAALVVLMEQDSAPLDHV